MNTININTDSMLYVNKNKKENKNINNIKENKNICVNVFAGNDVVFFDSKIDRRAQYIRNKIEKKLKYNKKIKENKKNKKEKQKIIKMNKVLVAAPNVKEAVLAASEYMCQSKKLIPGFLMWMNWARVDAFLPESNLFWFHIEKLVSVIQLLKSCDSLANMVHILNLYLGIYFDGSMLPGFIALFEKCTSSFMTCQSSGLDLFKSLLNNWQAIKESEAARQLYHFISTVLATGLCKVNNINLCYKGLEVFKVAAAKKVANLVDLVQVIIETTVFFYERGCIYLQTNNLWDLMYSDSQLLQFEKEYAFVLANEPHALLSEWEAMGMSSLDYHSLMEKVTSDILGMIKVSTGPEKSNLTTKLIMLEKVKIRVKRANVAPSMRMKPFGVCLFGGTGVGKSSVLPYMIHYLNMVNGFESSKERVVTLNPADKFQSEIKCNTNVVIIDDIMNQKLEVSEGSPGDLIIRLLNNIPAAALKAEVEAKGNVMMNPNFVYGTTNVKNLCASQLSNEPVSILRRFEYFITTTVKDEYKRKDSGMLDSSKIRTDKVPDAWWFKVEYVVPVAVHDGHAASPNYIIAEDDGRKLEKIGFQQLLDYLGHQSKIHFDSQRSFVSRSADIFKMKICENCKQFENFCNCEYNIAEMNVTLESNHNITFGEFTAPLVSSVRHFEGDDSDNDSLSDFDYVNSTEEECEEALKRDLMFAEQVQEFQSMQKKRLEYQTNDWFKDIFDKERIKKNKIKHQGDGVKSNSSSEDSFIVSDDDGMTSADDQTPVASDSENRTKISMDQLFFGINMPTKTRFEHLRDRTIKTVIKNPFLQGFITGQYNSMLGWSAVCWNFLYAKWKTDRWDCMFFMLLLMINSAVIATITLPVAIATKCGWCAVSRIDRCHEWASDRMTDFLLKHSKLTTLRTKKIKQIKKVMKLSLYGVSIMSAAYLLKKAFKAYKAYNCQTLSSGGALPVDEKHKVDHWAPAVISKVVPSLRSSTTTPEQLRSLIEKKLGNAVLTCTETGRRSQMVIFPLCNNVWVINSHALTGYAQKVEITIREPGTVGPNFSDMIGINNTFHIPDNDLALVVLSSGGSQFDFTEYFPKDKEMGRYMCSILYKGPDAKINEQRVLAEGKKIRYGGPKQDINIMGFLYSTHVPTFDGMCMSPLMTYDSRPMILGFHCCGITGSREGGAAMLCRTEITQALEYLKGRKGLMVAHSACIEGLNLSDIGPYKTVSLLENIHPKSPFKFLEKGSFNLYGQHSGPRQRPSTSVVKTLLSDAIEEVFDIPCIWGPPENINNYIPKHKEAVRMCEISAMDADRMALAANDYCMSIIDTLPDSALRGIQPLSKEITLSGQDGIAQLRSVVMSTSCGFPINKPKSTVLTRTGVSSDFVTDVIEAPDYVWDRVEKCEKMLLAGKRCHFVFKCSLKDEPKKIGSGKVRVFAGVSLEGLLIVRKYFLPLGVIIMRNPYKFESAVGINAHGRDWDRFVKHVTQKGSDRMIAGDYASFDSSMSPTASMAAFSCLLYLASKCGYSEEDLTVMRGIATEICYPTYDFFGEIVVVSGSEPSGHPMTVFVNNIVNSLYIRYAYYSIYKFDKERFFNSYVTQMNYGDDNVMSVSEDRVEFNHTAIQRELEKSGVVYTMADKEGVSIPFIKMEDCSFLKRSFRYDEEREVYLGPLEVMSLFKTLHTCVKSDTISLELQNRDMVSSVLFEAFLQGKEFYDDFRMKMKIVLKKCSVEHWFPKGIPSFATQQEVWDGRYLCEDNGQHENPHGSGVVGDSYIFE